MNNGGGGGSEEDDGRPRVFAAPGNRGRLPARRSASPACKHHGRGCVVEIGQSDASAYPYSLFISVLVQDTVVVVTVVVVVVPSSFVVVVVVVVLAGALDAALVGGSASSA